MKERKKKYVALWQVMQRECRRLVSRPLYLFCMVIAPLFCYLFFTTLMDSGLPQNLPAGVVDMDDSSRCVMYPNMCFSGSVYEVVEEDAKESLEEVLSPEEYKEVLSSGNYKVQFKYLSFLNDLSAGNEE